jgi:importin subunit beta-1
LDKEFKEQMKVAILATLASPKGLVRRQIAQILSAIASIEIPRKEWDELIPNLCTNASNEELNIRLASLTTLGYICDEVSPNDIS